MNQQFTLAHRRARRAETGFPETTRELRHRLRAIPSEALEILIAHWRQIRMIDDDDVIWFCRAPACARAILAARATRRVRPPFVS